MRCGSAKRITSGIFPIGGLTRAAIFQKIHGPVSAGPFLRAEREYKGNLMIITNYKNKLSDTILAEPAIFALGQLTGEKQDVWIDLNYRQLFDNHPWINILEQKPENPDVVIDYDKAYFDAIERQDYFGSGFFRQLEIEPLKGHRRHFKYFDGYTYDYRPYIAFAPFSYSCGSILSENNRNICPNNKFWKEFIDKIVKLDSCIENCLFSLGSDKDPTFFDISNISGKNWRTVTNYLCRSRVLITVETGILHLATTCNVPTLYLSSATPEWFCKPKSPCEVVRADKPANFDPDEAVEKFHKLLKLTENQ